MRSTIDNPSIKHDLAVVILAAGRGKRLGGEVAKATIATDEAPLIHHVLGLAESLAPTKIIVVTGYQKEQVIKCVTSWRTDRASQGASPSFVEQKQLLGTGDAVRAAIPQLLGFTGQVLILCGDVPLLTPESVRKMIDTHEARAATITLASFFCQPPSPYGRVVRSHDGVHVERIVEARDCTPAQLALSECNAGVYLVESAFLLPALDKLTNENAQREYYLTDIVSIAHAEGQTVAALQLADAREAQGVNTFEELALVNETLRHRRIVKFMGSGVRFIDKNSVYIEPRVTIGAGTTIGPSVQLLGTTTIGAEVIIEGTALLADCTVADRAHVKLGVRAEDASIGCDAMVGPFAHLRPGSVLGSEVKVGNFVETKKAVLAEGAKVSHLTYLGDCTVGKDANIGAGTITCNYDGYQKFETRIGEGAFIGSNSSLVAPVEIGAGATVGAGSVITKNVAPDALAVCRATQVEKAGWSKLKRERAKGAAPKKLGT